MQASNSHEQTFLNDHEVAILEGLEHDTEIPQEHQLVRGNKIVVNVLTRWFAG